MRLLLTLGLVLGCTIQAKVINSVKNFDFKKLIGRWYPLLLASSDGGSNSAALLHSIDTVAGNLLLRFTIRRSGECSEVPIFAQKLEANKYQLKYPGKHYFSVEDADPNEFLLLYTSSEIHGMETKGVELYSRQKEKFLSNLLKSKFEQTYTSRGMKKENVLDLIKTDICYHYSK